MIWENRKLQLLHELLQYNPDVVTLQECDHYYDFFLPELTLRGTNNNTDGSYIRVVIW